MKSVDLAQSETVAARPTLTLESLLRRADAGDTSVVPDLRSLLEQPAMLNLLGNLAYRVECDIVDRLAGKNLALQEGLKMKLHIMREELAGPDASPLERQLVERIVVCWLSVYEAEFRFANSGELTIKQSDYCQRRIDHAHRRYLYAVKTLATVRKLAIPVIVGQLNIAEKQVNVMNANVCGPH